MLRLLYVLVVTVIVGAAPTAELAGSSTPVADVADSSLIQWGVLVVVVAAILALISTALEPVRLALRLDGAAHETIYYEIACA